MFSNKVEKEKLFTRRDKAEGSFRFRINLANDYSEHIDTMSITNEYIKPMAEKYKWEDIKIKDISIDDNSMAISMEYKSTDEMAIKFTEDLAAFMIRQ